jgi:hypothetical protein
MGWRSRGPQHAWILVLRVMGWRSLKQRRNRNEIRQKDESSHIQTHARSRPFADDRLSSRATSYVIAVALTCASR